MREMQAHTWLKTKMKSRYGTNQIHIKSPSGIYSSRRGISDFIYCVKGKFVAIEVKSPTGKATLIQLQFLKEVKEAGGLGILLIGKDDSVFKIIDNWVDK